MSDRRYRGNVRSIDPAGVARLEAERARVSEIAKRSDFEGGGLSVSGRLAVGKARVVSQGVVCAEKAVMRVAIGGSPPRRC